MHMYVYASYTHSYLSIYSIPPNPVVPLYCLSRKPGLFCVLGLRVGFRFFRGWGGGEGGVGDFRVSFDAHYAHPESPIPLN